MTDHAAVLSPCGSYRYHLRRSALVRGPNAGNVCLFVMLNPSTADADQDDPTIRRCCSFAQATACGVLEVVNLFALRATDPRELLAHPAPVGPENDDAITEAVQRADIVVAAWGGGRERKLNRLVLERLRQVPEALARRRLLCLGTTSRGDPRHPLFVPGAQRLEPWRGRIGGQR